jgi:hypothetical protein
MPLSWVLASIIVAEFPILRKEPRDNFTGAGVTTLC